jgi:zinc protease
MKKYLIACLLCLLPITSWCLNQPRKTFVYKLDNGLQLIVRVDQRAPVVLSSVWYRVGGSYEHDGITGISHMLEHMMFKGTKKFGPGELIKIVSQNGGQQNAMTADDFTMYYQQFSADKLPISFKLEADRMRHLLLKAKSFAEEKKVVMEERRMRIDDNPQAVTWERFRAAAFINNPYHHPVAGWMTDIKHLTLNNLKNWYQKWYAPNNAVVIVVGKVDPQKVLALAKKYFGPLKPSQIIPPKPRTEVPTLGERVIHVSVPAKLPWLVMGYNVPTLVTAKPKWEAYALLVAGAILDSGNSSRFPRVLIMICMTYIIVYL